VSLLSTRKFPANKRRNENLAVLGKIVGSNSNIGSQCSVVCSQTEGICALVKNFEALITIAGAATKVDNLVADLTGTFHDKGVSVRLLDLSNGSSRTSLDFNHLSSIVVLRMSNPVVGESASLLKQLAVLLCGLYGLDRSDNVGVIVGLNSRLLHLLLGFSNLHLWSRLLLLTSKLLAFGVSLVRLSRATDSNAAKFRRV